MHQPALPNLPYSSPLQLLHPPKQLQTGARNGRRGIPPHGPRLLKCLRRDTQDQKGALREGPLVDAEVDGEEEGLGGEEGEAEG